MCKHYGSTREVVTDSLSEDKKFRENFTKNYLRWILKDKKKIIQQDTNKSKTVIFTGFLGWNT